MTRTNVHGFKQFIDNFFTLGTGMNSKFLVHELIIFFFVEFGKVLVEVLFEDGFGDDRIHGLGKSLKIPLDNLGLSTIAVSFVFIGSIGYIVFGKVVDKSKGSIVDGLVHHTHVISVENTMDEAINLPVSNKLGSLLNDNSVHLLIGIALILANARVAVF